MCICTNPLHFEVDLKDLKKRIKEKKYKEKIPSRKQLQELAQEMFNFKFRRKVPLKLTNMMYNKLWKSNKVPIFSCFHFILSTYSSGYLH